MPILRIAAIDPALSNMGMAKLALDLDTMQLSVIEMSLIETTRQVTKQVRQNSDDLRRAKQLSKAFHAFVEDCLIVFAEIPTGAQSARAMYAFGVAVGILGGCPKPLIQVQPSETKLATVGTKTASKDEVIEWAVETYPDAQWLRVKRKGVLELVAKNEHCADACAIATAGIKTEQFLSVIEMWRSSRAAASVAA